MKETADEGAGAERPRLGLRERKAIETRRRLLSTTLDLMAREGPDGVTIAAVADRSDIAVGTFYNYFPSREAVIETVVDLEIGTMARRLDALSVTDPATRLSVAIRHVVRTAITDPTWGWLLVRLGPDTEGAGGVLGERLQRMIEQGRESGRFLISDVQAASAMMLGALLAAIRVFLDTASAPNEAASLVVESQLRALGVLPDDAAKLSTRWLPDLPVFADQGALSIVRIAL